MSFDSISQEVKDYSSFQDSEWNHANHCFLPLVGNKWLYIMMPYLCCTLAWFTWLHPQFVSSLAVHRLNKNLKCKKNMSGHSKNVRYYWMLPRKRNGLKLRSLEVQGNWHGPCTLDHRVKRPGGLLFSWLAISNPQVLGQGLFHRETPRKGREPKGPYIVSLMSGKAQRLTPSLCEKNHNNKWKWQVVKKKN